VRALPSLVIFLTLAPTTFAGTFIVDDDGGPGVDFTDIAPAIAAAQAGDVLLVQPGNYAGFVLDKGLQILGGPGVVVHGAAFVANLPPAPRATLQGLRLQQLEIAQSLATILAIDVVVEPGYPLSAGYEACVEVRGAADVRLRNVVAWPDNPHSQGCAGMLVESSRVELTHSQLTGRRGQDGEAAVSGMPGFAGIDARAGANVHVSLSTIRGGRGGDYTNFGNPWFLGRAGDGAPAITLAGDAQVLVTGRASDVIEGAQSGTGDDCSNDGVPAPAVRNAGVASFVQHSALTFQGGRYFNDCGGQMVAPFAGHHLEVSPVDPSLQMSGSGVPGTQAVYTLRGAPGDAARLRIGRQLALVDLPGVLEDRLLFPVRTYDLGTIPASGERTFTLNLPASLPDGFLILAQGSVVSPSGTTRLSQCVPIVLR